MRAERKKYAAVILASVLAATSSLGSTNPVWALESTQQRMTEQENEKQDGIYKKRNCVLHQTNGEEIFPLHTEHEMQP